MSNTSRLSLQSPKEINNRTNSVSSTAETPVVNPAQGTTNTYKNRAPSIEIPKWNDFHNYNEVPTMDYSPIYAKNTPNYHSRKGTPQNLKTQTPIRIGCHDEVVKKKNSPKGLIQKVFEFLFGSDDEYN